MYTIKQRSKAVHKQLMIIPNDGREQVIFNVDLIPEQVAGKFGELCWKIQQETEKKQINAAALGEAIVGLLTIIFGIEQTKTIMEIYKNNYTDLLLDITPFLIEDFLLLFFHYLLLFLYKSYSDLLMKASLKRSSGNEVL